MRQIQALLVACAVMLFTGCATLEAEGEPDLSKVAAFTVLDLQTALVQAAEQGDQAGINCWTTLLEVVASDPIKAPNIQGIASAMQARRGVTNSGGLNALKRRINVGCAALVVSEAVTLGRLLGKGLGAP